MRQPGSLSPSLSITIQYSLLLPRLQSLLYSSSPFVPHHFTSSTHHKTSSSWTWILYRILQCRHQPGHFQTVCMVIVMRETPMGVEGTLLQRMEVVVVSAVEEEEGGLGVALVVVLVEVK
uniref:Uncharacterized protein n=1 Tax=Lepeophtheirus salmonis TaxID=72036 RepID=A0A0K2TRU2_LEPSM